MVKNLFEIVESPPSFFKLFFGASEERTGYTSLFKIKTISYYYRAGDQEGLHGHPQPGDHEGREQGLLVRPHLGEPLLVQGRGGGILVLYSHLPPCGPHELRVSLLAPAQFCGLAILDVFMVVTFCYSDL